MILKHLEINSIKITPTKENNMVKLNYYNKMLKLFGFKLVMLIIIVSCPILISGKTFTIASPGDLINQVDMDEVEDIVEIKLIGKINGTDILTMNKMVNLTSIDLSEATIVEGGMPYYETDNNRFGTQNNTLGEYWAYNLDLLTSVKLPGNLTTIGSRAFFKFDHLSELIIPCSVILIGSEAFRNCSALKSVTIGNSVTEIGGWAFFGCSALTSVTIGKSVTKIGGFAFYDCTELKELTFEDGYTTLSLGNNSYANDYYQYGLFSECPLETLYLGRNLSYENAPFKGKKTIKSVTIGNSVTKIDKSAFESCYALTSVTIPNSVTEICDAAFSYCFAIKEVHISSLDSWCKIDFGSSDPFYSAHRNLYLNGELIKDLVIPESISEIKPYAFSGCSKLTSVTIPNSVTSIGKSAFSGCSGLISVTIPNSVTEIGGWAFRDCSKLTSVTIPNSVTEIGSSAFDDCSGLTSVTIGNSVTEIGSSAFSGCSGLTAIIIPNSVTEIGNSAFSGCSGLTSVTIGNSVTEIGYRAFRDCSGLTSIILPGSVRSIGAHAFAHCYNLTEINTINPIPAVIESNTFEGCTDNATLNVPDGSRNIYWIHPYWGQFKTINTTTESDAQFVADNITYYITSVELGTVEVSAANISSKSRAGVEVIIPKEVTYNNKKYIVAGIANNGFVGADISAITLPETISYVGLDAFKGCKNITTVTCLSLLPPSVDESSFEESVYGKATLVIDPSAESVYKNDEVWSQFYALSPTSIDDIESEGESAVRVEGGNIIAPEGSEVFDLSGRRVSVTGIRPGIYIVRIPGGRAVKVRL